MRCLVKAQKKSKSIYVVCYFFTPSNQTIPILNQRYTETNPIGYALSHIYIYILYIYTERWCKFSKGINHLGDLDGRRYGDDLGYAKVCF